MTKNSFEFCKNCNNAVCRKNKLNVWQTLSSLRTLKVFYSPLTFRSFTCHPSLSSFNTPLSSFEWLLMTGCTTKNDGFEIKNQKILIEVKKLIARKQI